MVDPGLVESAAISDAIAEGAPAMSATRTSRPFDSAALVDTMRSTTPRQTAADPLGTEVGQELMSVEGCADALSGEQMITEMEPASTALRSASGFFVSGLLL